MAWGRQATSHYLKQCWPRSPTPHGDYFICTCYTIMTSSNGNIFRVTGPLCGEFTDEFPSQGPLTWNFDVFFDLRLNKRVRKQSWGWWFETPSHSLWRHCNELHIIKHNHLKAWAVEAERGHSPKCPKPAYCMWTCRRTFDVIYYCISKISYAEYQSRLGAFCAQRYHKYHHEISWSAFHQKT